jgi:hypothetical protein
MGKLGVCLGVVVVALTLYGVASADDEWKTAEGQKAWLSWDQDVGDALQGRGNQPERPIEDCALTLRLQGHSYRSLLEDWERRRLDPDLSRSVSAFPPDPPKLKCRASMFSR